MPDFGNSVCAMLVPRASDLERLSRVLGITTPNPHVTLFYLGKAENFTEDQIDAVRSLVKNTFELTAYVTGIEKFNGDNDDETPVVLTLESSRLQEWNKFVVNQLKAQGIKSESKFSDKYRPHMTIAYQPKSEPIPPKFLVDYFNLTFDTMWFTTGTGDLFWPLLKTNDGFSSPTLLSRVTQQGVSMPDENLVALAKITRVSAHRRKNEKGGSEQVDSYLRKVLDSAGAGFGDKTRKGAFENGGKALSADEKFAATVKDGLEHPYDRRRDEQAENLERKMKLKKAEVAQYDAKFDANRKRGLEIDQRVRDRRAEETGRDGDRERAHRAEEPDSGKKPSPWDIKGQNRGGLVTYTDPDTGKTKSWTKKYDRAWVPTDGGSEMIYDEELIAKTQRAKDSLFHKKVSLSAEDSPALVALAGKLDWSPKKNWVENSGGLPKYIEDVAIGIMKSGKSREQAIPIAISKIKKWAAGGDAVNADTVAKATAALAAWEKLKATAASNRK